MFAKEMLKQSLPLLIVCGFGGIIAGSTLSGMISILKEIPGLIVVVPAVIALRGNINTTLGSRLGSAYHLGVIDADNMWNDELKQNILGSLVLSFLMSFIIGVLAFLTSLLLGVTPNPILLIRLIIIVVIAGGLAGLILTFLTIGIIYFVFKRGLDPDNITGPALATVGDIVTMLCIFISALIVGGLT